MQRARQSCFADRGRRAFDVPWDRIDAKPGEPEPLREMVEVAGVTATDVQLVVVWTQLGNAASIRVADNLGFIEARRFEDYGAIQWLGVRSPPTF
ncbi:MAG TPA: hypothetical protein VG502_17560 [Flexivirga sp.]|uniref:hypothetical protein n=1 Tax=Flexivirga sp. TaxID=1962927 RepID=UPI002CC0CDC5|nr:hypothetical protein [Flexivirga sp.]HWC24106.1 hypothetical protein [Flexivirga sp.]